MELEKNNICASTPVATATENEQHGGGEEGAGTTRKRTASSSPGADINSGERSGQKKYAKDDLVDINGELAEQLNQTDHSQEVIMIDEDSNVCEKAKGVETESKGNDSHINSCSAVPPGQKVNVFNSSYFSDDLSNVYSTTQEIYGIKDSLLADLKSLSSNWQRGEKLEKHDVACQSNSLLITPLVKTLFSTGHSPLKQGTIVESVGEGIASSSEGLANNLPLENNLFLRAIAGKIDTMVECVDNHGKAIVQLDGVVSEFEKYTDKSLKGLSERIDINKQSCASLQRSIEQVTEYTDTKIANLREAIPLTLAEVGGNLEKRIEVQNSTLLERVREELDKHPVSGSIVGGIEETFRQKLILFENQTNQRLGMLEEKCVDFTDNKINMLRDELAKSKERMDRMEAQHNEQIRDCNVKLEEAMEVLRKLKADDQIGNTGFIMRNEWRLQKQKTDELSDRISSVETNIDICAKKTDAVDLIVRKSNVIIDQLTEFEGEDIGQRIKTILANTIRPEDLQMIKVLRVFRLGTHRAGGPP